MSDCKALCAACGLSQSEAASFLDVRPDTVKSWWSGRRNPPDGALDDLADLWAKVDRAAATYSTVGDAPALMAGDGPDLMARGIALARRRRALR